MFKLGQKVVIVGDLFEQNLPVGDYAYIIAYEKNADNAFDYVIRVPKLNRHFFIPTADIELEEILIRQEADRVEQEALIDFALATRNEKLFHSLLGEEESPVEEKEAKQEVLSEQEFIKKVNLRAWI